MHNGHINIDNSLKWLVQDEFLEFYNNSLVAIKDTIIAIDKNPKYAMDIVYSLKNREFNQILRGKY